MELYERKLYEEYLKYVDDLDGDIQGKQQVRAAFAGSNATWAEKPLPCNYLPFLGSSELRRECVASGDILYSILKKIIGHYKLEPAYRKLFSFNSRVEELIMLPNTCGEELPFLRVDFIFSEEEQKMVFCEFNTDACGGMVEQKAAIKALKSSAAFASFSKKHTIATDEELPYQGWVDAYASMYRHFIIVDNHIKSASSDNIDISDAGKNVYNCGDRSKLNNDKYNKSQSINGVYRAEHSNEADENTGISDEYSNEYGNKSSGSIICDVPKAQLHRLAIVVCFDSPQPDVSMFLDFIPYFNKAGFQVSIFDVRELSFDGECLYGKKALYGDCNVAIDCVWKFCVTVDLLQHWDAVQPFIRAMASGKIFAAGAFSTQLAHDKQIMAVMHHPRTQELLTAQERAFIREHIPYTVLLEDIVSAQGRNPGDMEKDIQVDMQDKNIGNIQSDAQGNRRRDIQVNLKSTSPSHISSDAIKGDICGSTKISIIPTIEQIKAEPAKWILKPADWYASIDVIAGRSCSRKEWGDIIDKCLREDGSGKHWLLQRFYAPGKVPSIPLYGNEADYTAPVQQYGNMFGIFMHSGKYGGVFLRQGPKDVIGDSTGGINCAVLWVD